MIRQILFAVTLLGIPFFLGACDDNEVKLPPGVGKSYHYIERPEDVITFENQEQAAAALREICSGLPPAEETFTVVKITDGDTIVLAGNRTIRIIGIDAPEEPPPDRAGEAEPYSAEATQYIRRLLEGRLVRLELDEEKTDNYDRELAYVFALPRYEGDETIFVNAEMVLAGYALAKRIPPDVRYADILSGLEEFAAKNKRGLWETTPAGYVASRKSRTMVFHRKGCMWAEKIAPKNLVEFGSRKEALLAGYQPCSRCKP